MDRLVELIVRIVSAVAGWAHVVPGVEFARYVPGKPLKVLLAGYNGARNTGSDVRVSALARQLTDLLGRENVDISVMTLDAASTAPYFDADVRQVPFNTLFFGKLLKACSENHVAILCEGSTFKSQFADALTLYSCQTAGVMRAQGKPCIAYGCEVGAMEPYLRRAVQSLCSDVRYAVRSEGSLEALRELGLDGYQGTDTAWNFDSSAAHDEAVALLRDGGWDGTRPLLGIAPVNPFCWPVKPSLSKLARALATGDRSRQYQSWYFFSWSAERARKFDAYIEEMAQACMTFAAENNFQPVVFGMEQLDSEACSLLRERLGGDVPVFLSNERDGFVMGEALRSLSLLVTSRYHAQVLATESLVPTVAVSMDERLKNLAVELACDPRLLLRVDDSELAPRLLLALDFAYEKTDTIRDDLACRLSLAKGKLDDMGQWLVGQLSAC